MPYLLISILLLGTGLLTGLTFASTNVFKFEQTFRNLIDSQSQSRSEFRNKETQPLISKVNIRPESAFDDEDEYAQRTEHSVKKTDPAKCGYEVGLGICFGAILR